VAAVQQIQAGGRIYTTVEDLRTRYRLVFGGRVVEEDGGAPLRAPFAVTAGYPGLWLKALRDGFFAAGGVPERLFPLLATTPYAVDLEVTAAGYRPASASVHLPAGAAFPRPLVTLELRRLPIRIQGRVVETAGEREPIAGAAVDVADPRLLALRTPLRFAHPAATPVAACPLAPVGGALATRRVAAAGGTVLDLDRRTGLAPGSVVRLGAAGRYEFRLVDAVATPPDPSQPGEVTLRQPLLRTLEAGGAVQRVDPGAATATTTLAAAAEAGEALLRLGDDLDAAAVRIEAELSPRVEYQAVGTVTGGDGYYRLDGVGPVSRVRLEAGAAGYHEMTVPKLWVLDYGQPVNVVDLSLEKVTP